MSKDFSRDMMNSLQKNIYCREPSIWWKLKTSSLWTQRSYYQPHQHCNFVFLLAKHEVDQRLEMVLFSFLDLHLVVCGFSPKPCFPSWFLRFHQIHTFEILNEGDDDMVTSFQSNSMNDILPTLLKKNFGIGCSFYNL